MKDLNEVTQTCEMDLNVRYWDVACSQVKMRYFDSNFMGHGTCTGILQYFDKTTKLYQEFVQKLWELFIDWHWSLRTEVVDL